MTEKRENACMWQDRKHHLWFQFSFTKYYITNDRLMVKEGLSLQPSTRLYCTGLWT